MRPLTLFLKKWFVIVILLPAIFACASSPSSLPASDDGDSERVVNKDPFEGFNRVIYGFNDQLDTYLIKPVAQGYRWLSPGFVETGVSNFFANLLEVRNVLNSGLQAKGDKMLHHTGRLVINSTFGIFGLFDLAQHMGLEKTDGEDFGQTLGVWGVGSGPYIVWPFLGPSTIRDSAGLPVDTYADPIAYIDHFETRLSFSAGKLIDLRANLVDTESLLSGDRYLFIRDAYLQRRDFLVKDGKVEDDFGQGVGDDDEFF